MPSSHRAGGSQRIPRPPAWMLGNAAPWAVPTPLTAGAVSAVVADAGPLLAQTPPTFPDSRPSAVLIALVDGDRGAEVLLTKRSPDLRHHAGEISFPGGRIDPGESTVDAALREANEEVGLHPVDATVAGRLSPLSTVVSRSYIMPIVATLQYRPMLVPHEAEVARILWVPLAELAELDTYREERWGTPPLDRRMHFFELDDETIWGATAHILRELLDVVYGPPATRTAL
ncbi:MAG: CoA pyrophosphatase [Ilumatobacteraceae bacterium]